MKNTKPVKGIGRNQCGIEEHDDPWVRRLSIVVDQACAFFWTRTPERRQIQREFLAKLHGY
jgi:hypothetical protein